MAVDSAQRRTLLAIMIIVLGQILTFVGFFASLALFIVGLVVMVIVAIVSYLWRQPQGRFTSPSFQSTKHCGFCGEKIRSSMVFCPKCGNRQV
ncbi:MAG TPA: hypothetical protein VFF30_01040 [Nitrososphaerales archaeon]|nr:hypothetical protein [Nitrososphaerales archaeon]